ncbi:dual specificity protein phosphatase family protein [uncultured Maribacter sp.]|uniref:dual specificity protein phosphatase family protein n=1 Tax=uncultured Maribacter sp. TaxID=431308 RepID=UPI0026329530|nr:dual specificity protein phosphatase family protein [uncultured Maribacter sp.]
MKIPKKFYFLSFFSLLSFAFSLPITHMQEYNFKQIESENFTNFYRLNDSVYRSEQPSKKGMKELEAMGIKSILNLRRQKTDEKKIKGLNLQLNRIPLKAATIDFDDIFNALRSMQQAEKPVLVHCWHGSDRTGAIIAASRMVFENWSKEKAIAEFTSKPFGYHRKRFPNLIPLLKSLDVELLRNKLKQEHMSKPQ